MDFGLFFLMQRDERWSEQAVDRALLRLRTFREYLADGWALIGAPAEVRDGLQQYLDATGYQRVLLLMALPGIETALALRSMRLFVESVAPALKGATAVYDER